MLKRLENETDEEYKIRKKEYNKQWELNHKVERKEQNKNYRLEHKDQLKKYREEHKEDKKVWALNYYEINRENILNKNKQYHNLNKEKIKAIRDNLRNKIIILLGNKCINPYNIDHSAFEQNPNYFKVLQIDHINGGGCKQRKQFKYIKKYYEFILEQLKVGSKDYQCLCPTCNWIKRGENEEI